MVLTVAMIDGAATERLDVTFTRYAWEIKKCWEHRRCVQRDGKERGKFTATGAGDSHVNLALRATPLPYLFTEPLYRVSLF